MANLSSLFFGIPLLSFVLVGCGGKIKVGIPNPSTNDEGEALAFGEHRVQVQESNLVDQFPSLSNIRVMLAKDDVVYLIAETAPGIRKAFIMSGAGTQQVASTSGSASLSDFSSLSSVPSEFILFNDTVYFYALNSNGKTKLFKLNGLTPVQVSNTAGDENVDDYPVAFVVDRSHLYFSASAPEGRWKLHRISTEGVVERLSNVAGNGQFDYAVAIGHFGGHFWFRADPGSGDRLYQLNGTTITDLSSVLLLPYSRVLDVRIATGRFAMVLRDQDNIEKLFEVTPDMTFRQIASGSGPGVFELSLRGFVSENLLFTKQVQGDTPQAPVTRLVGLSGDVIDLSFNSNLFRSISAVVRLPNRRAFASAGFQLGSQISSTIVEIGTAEIGSLFSLNAPFDVGVDDLRSSPTGVSFLGNLPSGARAAFELADAGTNNLIARTLISSVASLDPYGLVKPTETSFRCEGSPGPRFFVTRWGSFLEGFGPDCKSKLFKFVSQN